MRVVVTGGAGYMGSVVSRLLLDQGHKVRVLDSLLHGGQGILPLYLYDNFSFIGGDVRSTDVVTEALRDTDAVVHLAAIVGDPACARQPELAREVNLDAALQVHDLCQQMGVHRFVFASTCSNYGRVADPTSYVTEESELRPVSLYAETKVAVENALLDSRLSAPTDVAILRFATLFGLSPRMRFDLTVNHFTMELLTTRNLMVFGQQFWRPYVHVLDAARAIALALEAPVSTMEHPVFNVGGTDQNFTKGQLPELIRTQIEGPVNIEFKEVDEDPRDYKVSFQKVEDELGFKISRTVPDGIREIIDSINKGVLTDFDDQKYRN